MRDSETGRSAGRAARWICVFFAVLTAGMGGKSNGAEIVWRRDFVKACQEANRLQRPVLLQFTAAWCGHCHTMLKHTFTDATIVARVNELFVPVLLDADEHPELIARLGIEAFPVTIVLSPDLRSMKKFIGYRNAAALDELLVLSVPRQANATVGVAVKGDIRSADANHAAPAARPGIVDARVEEEEQAGEERAEEDSTTEPALLPAPDAQPKLAFRGICLVSMLDTGAIVDGHAEFTSTHCGRIVRFASAEFKARFDHAPEKYWPMQDGRCVVSARDEDCDREGDPEIAAVYRNRLWFFADDDHRKAFAADSKSYGQP